MFHSSTIPCLTGFCLHIAPLQFDLQKIFQHLLNHLIPNEKEIRLKLPRTRLFVQVGLFSLFFRFRVGVMVFHNTLT